MQLEIPNLLVPNQQLIRQLHKRNAQTLTKNNFTLPVQSFKCNNNSLQVFIIIATAGVNAKAGIIRKGKTNGIIIRHIICVANTKPNHHRKIKLFRLLLWFLYL